MPIAGRGTPFDLLFTDIVMPGRMNGRQLAERMMAERPALRVLFTSGYAYGAVHAQGRAGQGIPMLTKPYRKAELARMLRRCLDPAVDPAAIRYRCHIPFSPNSIVPAQEPAIAARAFSSESLPALDAGWIPVRVKKTRQTKDRALFRSIGTEKALAATGGFPL